MGRLKDGLMKRGSTWSYVIRAVDPESGRSRPRWVGGFATEKDAKAARDDARVKARRREYVDRSRVTVAEYLVHGSKATRSRSSLRRLPAIATS
jgi:integrase